MRPRLAGELDTRTGPRPLLVYFRHTPEAGAQAQLGRDLQHVIVGQVQSGQTPQLHQAAGIHPVHLVVAKHDCLQGNNVIEDLGEGFEPVIGRKTHEGVAWSRDVPVPRRPGPETLLISGVHLIWGCRSLQRVRDLLWFRMMERSFARLFISAGRATIWLFLEEQKTHQQELYSSSRTKTGQNRYQQPPHLQHQRQGLERHHRP